MRLGGLAVATFALLTLGAIKVPMPDMILKIEPSSHTLYDWSKQRCDDEYIPDAPARAYRRADGSIVLLATHHENWIMTGKSLLEANPECASVLSSQALPASMGRLWIEGIRTQNGTDVVAIVSQDLSYYNRSLGCQKGTGRLSGRCWLNNLLVARSSNGGRSYELVGKIAQTVERYPDAGTSRIGVFTSSNVVSRDGALFIIAFAQGGEGQKTGNCLLRTNDLSGATGWKAWDGQGFSIDLRTGAACPVLSGLHREVRSLSYVRSKSSWVAVYAGQHGKERVSGFYYATSGDLIKWSRPQLLVAAPIRPRESQTELWAYPSLIDPDSESRNFETIDGSSAVLFYTRTSLNKGNGTMNRDLAYLKITIE